MPTGEHSFPPEGLKEIQKGKATRMQKTTTKAKVKGKVKEAANNNHAKKRGRGPKAKEKTTAKAKGKKDKKAKPKNDKKGTANRHSRTASLASTGQRTTAHEERHARSSTND